MKKLVFISCIAMAFLACNNSQTKSEAEIKSTLADSANFTTIQWIDSLVDFGNVKQGDTMQIKFHCKNTGTKPLILVNVKPTCGCTVADYTKTPIAPGAEGLVVASFNSGHFCGTVHKTIIATANTIGRTDYNLSFTGNITNCQGNDKVVQPHVVPEPHADKPSHKPQ